MLRRDFTLDERFAFALAAARIRDEMDAELGRLLLACAHGDDTALTAAHDRLVEIGQPEKAARLLKLISE